MRRCWFLNTIVQQKDQGLFGEVVHIYNGILLSPKKEWNNAICNNMDDLEIVVLSEVSQKEKNKYCILMHICGL